MSLIEKFNQKNNFKNIIIVFSFIVVFYFWDFGAKYNLNIDTRFLTLVPLLFFLNFKTLKKFNFKIIYIFISYLLFQYILNFIMYKKAISITDLKYFIAFTLTTLLVVLFKNQILNNKKKIINFIIFMSPLFILTSTIELWSDIDKSWQCSIFNTQSKLFKLFFLENSHYAMIAIPAVLLNIFYLTKKFNYLNLSITIIFFSSLILFQSTTLVVGMIVNIFLIFISNFKNINFKFSISIVSIFLVLIVIFTNIYGCSRKVTDIFFHIYLMSLKNLEEIKNPVTKIEKFELYSSRIYSNFYSKSKLKENHDKIEKFTELNEDEQKRIFHKINVSSQVAKNSFEVAFRTIVEKPFGVGLNRFEDAFRDQIKLQSPNFSDEIMKINLNDGASNFAKLIAEFGIFTFILFIYLFIFIFSKKILIEDKLFLFPIIITQFLRGAGYFNGGFLVSMILIILIVNESKKKD